MPIHMNRAIKFLDGDFWLHLYLEITSRRLHFGSQCWDVVFYSHDCTNFLRTNNFITNKTRLCGFFIFYMRTFKIIQAIRKKLY